METDQMLMYFCMKLLKLIKKLNQRKLVFIIYHFLAITI